MNADDYANLDAACRLALTDAMRPGLRAAIDAALAGGAVPELILARVRLITGGPQAQPGGLTFLGVEAYLTSKCSPKPQED